LPRLVSALGLIDSDIVDESNLQRQILHWTSVGVPKSGLRAAHPYEINPDVKVKTYNLRLDASNVVDIFRSTTSSSAVRTISRRHTGERRGRDAEEAGPRASIFRFDGQMSTFVPCEGPSVASIRNRRRQTWLRVAMKPECWEFCPESWD
jgi:adenylyltransferase/sulfurtransferase